MGFGTLAMRSLVGISFHPSISSIIAGDGEDRYSQRPKIATYMPTMMSALWSLLEENEGKGREEVHTSNDLERCARFLRRPLGRRRRGSQVGCRVQFLLAID